MSRLDPFTQGDGNAPRLLSEINVTPFIDVMLVLLIIFMVAAPLMMVGVPLKLPKTAAQTATPAKPPLVVSLDKEGRLFVGADESSLEKLPEALAPLIRAEPETVVHVRADSSLDYGKVMDLLGRIGAGGVTRLSLVAEGRTLSNGSRP